MFEVAAREDVAGKARLNLPGLQSRAVFHTGKGTQKNQAPGCRGERVGGKGGGFRDGDQHREAGEPQPGEGGHGDVLQQEVAEVSRTAGLEGQAEGPGLYCEAGSVRGAVPREECRSLCKTGWGRSCWAWEQRKERR